MVKKRTIGIGVGVSIAIVIAVFILQPFISSIGIVAQQVEDADQLEIPFITPQEESNNEEIVEEAQEEISEPPMFTEEQLEEVANDPIMLPPEDVAEMLEELEEEITDPPLPEEDPNFSEDPPIEQVCDIEPESPLCQVVAPSKSLQLKSIVTKTDSDGVSTVQEDVFDLTTLALFVEEDTDRDFRTGFLTTELNLIGEPNTRYMGSGTVDLVVGQSSIFTEPIPISVDAVSDTDGIIQVLFVSPVGGTSDTLLFTFDDNFSRFQNEAVTQLAINIVDLFVTDEDSQEFSIQNQDVFTMEIFRDDIMILITDEEGITSRVYPSDSRIKVSTAGTGVNAQWCRTFYTMNGQAGGHTFTVTIRGQGTGYPDACISEGDTYTRVQDGVPMTYLITAEQVSSYRGSHPLLPIPPQQLTGFTLIDSAGNILFTSDGGNSGTVFDTGNSLLRNQTYTLQVSSPSRTSDITLDKNQQTKSYTCTAVVGAISHTLTGGSDTQASSRSFYTFQWTDLIPNQPSASGVNCNFP